VPLAETLGSRALLSQLNPITVPATPPGEIAKLATPAHPELQTPDGDTSEGAGTGQGPGTTGGQGGTGGSSGGTGGGQGSGTTGGQGSTGDWGSGGSSDHDHWRWREKKDGGDVEG
jgi:hypothetical protein